MLKIVRASVQKFLQPCPLIKIIFALVCTHTCSDETTLYVAVAKGSVVCKHSRFIYIRTVACEKQLLLALCILAKDPEHPPGYAW